MTEQRTLIITKTYFVRYILITAILMYLSYNLGLFNKEQQLGECIAMQAQVEAIESVIENLPFKGE